MAKRKSSTKAKTKTVYRTAPKKKRRTSTTNRSVKKPMQAIGITVGLAAVYGPAIVQSVKTMKTGPIAAQIMNRDAAVAAAKNAAIGYLAGTAAGMVADKTGLKKPVNKIIKNVRGLI